MTVIAVSADEIERLTASNAELLAALRLAQAVINPLSGFMKRGNPKSRKYIERLGDQIRAAIAKATTP